MSALSIQPTYPIFTETDGQPLEDGYIWIGVANLDPQGNPINVYWDAALTQLAGQPIRTQGGYPVNSGTPARLYVNSDYSIRVMNKNGSTVYSAPAATERYNGGVISAIDASQVVYTATGSNTVPVNQEDWNDQWLSVIAYGAVGDGVNDDWPAIQAALDDGVTLKRAVYLPSPTVKYCVSRPLVLDDGQQLIGESREKCVIEKTTTLGPSPALGIVPVVRGGVTYNYDYDKNAIVIPKKPAGRAYPNSIGIHNITLQAASGVTVDYGVYAPRLARSDFNQITVANTTNGWFTYDSWMCVFRRVECNDTVYGMRWENDGSGNGTGTSCTFIDCFVNRCSTYGWYLYGLTYSSIISCASESIEGLTAGSRPVAWFFNLCRGLSVISCGSEVVKGYVFRISGGSVNIRGGDFNPIFGDTFGADTAVVQLDNGAKVTIDGGTRFGATTSPGNIYNEIVIGSGTLLIYDGTVIRPSGGNTNPLFTGGGEIVVLGAAGQGFTRQVSSGTFYAVESSTADTNIPTADFRLTNPTTGFGFSCVTEPVAANRVLQWQNSSAVGTGGWEWFSSDAGFNKVRLGVYNDGTLKVSPPLTPTAGALVGYITVNIDGTDRKIPYYAV